MLAKSQELENNDVFMKNYILWLLTLLTKSSIKEAVV